MWISILFLVLLILITLRISSQGMFSALIMAVLTICCCALAIGTYEWTAIHWVAPMWKPDYARPVALAASFGVPLIVLRVIADRLVRRNCLLPLLVERIGGGFCGLITAYVVVGVMALAIQMVPLGGSILGFSRVNMAPANPGAATNASPPQAEETDSELWLTPDRFAINLASLLSAGIFSAEQNFGIENPDTVQAMGWNQAADLEVSRFAPPGSISIVRTGMVASTFKFTPGRPRKGKVAEYKSVSPKPGTEFRMIRVKLSNSARDERKSFGFTLRQFRLVGHPSGSDRREQHFAMAIQQEDASAPINRHISARMIGNQAWPIDRIPYQPRSDAPNEVELVFELPRGFVPVHLAYKQSARVDVTFDAAEKPQDQPEASTSAPAATTDGTTASSGDSRGSRRRRRGGNVRGATSIANQSHFGDAFPLTLQDYQRRNNAEITRGKMSEGHLIAEVDAQTEGSGPRVTKFNVPRSQRLLHLRTENLQSGSSLGKVITNTVKVLQNYIVEDATGAPYKIVGKYATANVDGVKVFEVQYYPDAAGTIGGVGDFSRIKDKHLSGDYELVFLFLVKPGAEIVGFSTGGDASRKDDLTGEKLIAPD